MARNSSWSESDLQILRDLYPDNACSVLVELLGKKTANIYNMASKLGLKKSAAFFQSDMSGRLTRKQNEASKSRRFQPGLIPWNKGTNWTAGGRSPQTRFKPGQKPCKTQPIGAYRLVNEKTGRVHLEQKTSDESGANNKRWTPVSRLVWIEANGPIPDGHIVTFKKGMSTAILEEITIDKLECISRGQHANRNHPRNENPELSKLFQLKGAITRQVNRIKKEANEQSY